MSHASCLVVIESVELKSANNNIEKAVEWQMEPFNESGEWFKDGSRWDWYQIGGRYTGRLTGYDPDDDPRNYATCRWCAGTGRRTDMKVENGCNGCDGTGIERSFINADYSGDVQQKQDIQLAELHNKRIESAKKTYAKAMKEKSAHREFIYGVKDGESLNEFLIRTYPKPETAITHAAYLRNRHWHEPERMGWFGGTMATECERKADIGDVEAMVRRCKYKDEKTGACCVVWNEPWEVWSEFFWKRFIEPLSEDMTLVTVDYHV